MPTALDQSRRHFGTWVKWWCTVLCQIHLDWCITLLSWATNLKFDCIFKLNILWWCHLAVLRKSWLCVLKFNYEPSSIKLLQLLLQLFYGPLSGTTWASWHQKKHSPIHLSWPSSNLYQLLPCPTTHSIILVQFICLTIFLQNFAPRALWSTSWFGALHLHTFFFFTHVAIGAHTIAACFAVVQRLFPSLSLNSLLGTLSFTLTLYIHLTILISARWNATSLPRDAMLARSCES